MPRFPYNTIKNPDIIGTHLHDDSRFYQEQANIGLEDNDLNEKLLEAFMVGIYANPRHFAKWERGRLCGPTEATIEDIAYPPPRWKHEGSFQMSDGRWCEMWINWDGRARLECEGRIVMRWWWPAGEILRGIEYRRKAYGH